MNVTIHFNSLIKWSICTCSHVWYYKYVYRTYFVHVHLCVTGILVDWNIALKNSYMCKIIPRLHLKLTSVYYLYTGISSLLQGIVDSSAQKLVTLANQWEKHRVPLIEQYRELKELNSKMEVSVLKTLKTKGLILVELGSSTWILEDVNCNTVSLIFVVRGRKEIGRN